MTTSLNQIMTSANFSATTGGGKNKTRKNRKVGGNVTLGPDGKVVLSIPSGDTPLLGGGLPTVGSKYEVYRGKAQRTSGGLTRKDLGLNKRGKVVSLKQAAAGKKAFKRLAKAGYAPKKGQFKLFTRKN
jgi:hypothetical protein